MRSSIRHRMPRPRATARNGRFRRSAFRRHATRAALAWLLAGFAVGVSGCLEDRDLELVAGAEIHAAFQARGLVGALDGSLAIDLVRAADVERILRDNGFEDGVVARVESISYRVTRPDPNAPDRIASGVLTVDGRTLARYTHWIGDPALAAWTPLQLDQPDDMFDHGIDYIHMRLAEYFAARERGASNPPRPVITIVSSGEVSPAGLEADFDWEARIVLTLVGRKRIQVFDPL